MPFQTPLLFVSSTSEDLKPHRDAAVAADFRLCMMEYFVAGGDRPPLAACLAKVSEADVLCCAASRMPSPKGGLRVVADAAQGRLGDPGHPFPDPRAARGPCRAHRPYPGEPLGGAANPRPRAPPGCSIISGR
ncbi:MAG: DUF4062 domain-containing protein [Beggiatoa sp.]|nr:DUF4062 domain-containing protein [Beggiatoa sp.]